MKVVEVHKAIESSCGFYKWCESSGNCENTDCEIARKLIDNSVEYDIDGMLDEIILASNKGTFTLYDNDIGIMSDTKLKGSFVNTKMVLDIINNYLGSGVISNKYGI